MQHLSKIKKFNYRLAQIHIYEVFNIQSKDRWCSGRIHVGLT